MNKILELFDAKLIKFIIVGGINTLVGSAIMFGLYNLAGCSYWISSGADYLFTSILSFFLNKYFTFESKKWSWGQMLRFGINIASCYFIAFGVAKPLAFWIFAGFGERFRTNIAMLTGMVLFTGLNYLGQRLFAFSRE